MQHLTGSIARKLGALYLLLTTLLLGLGGVVLFQTRAITRDARILLEETREQALASEVLQGLEELQQVLLRGPDGDTSWGPAGLAAIERSERALDAIHGEQEHRENEPAEDPSRAEHQQREEAMLSDLRAELRALEAAARSALPPPGGSSERLTTLGAIVHELIEETSQECVVAGQDVERERQRLSRVTLGATSFALLLLAASSVLVLRRVVEPVRVLRDGVERFGHGDLEHRIELDTQDEFGALSRAFNDMAGRVAETHGELEERVLARTREFLRAARLADLGVLAAGVAHEINNPLASISASAEGLQRRARAGEVSPESVAEYAGTIHTEALRAKEITGRLLELARRDLGELSEFRLGMVLEHVRRTANYTGERRGVRMELLVDQPDTLVYGNAGELTQMCMNLVGNAMDASRPGDVVVLRCQVDGGQLLVEVRDTGEGISPEDLERIFEPFFTTKRAGNGTGLGLALVEAMVQSRGGRVRVRSRVGEGSEFRLELPLRWRNA